MRPVKSIFPLSNSLKTIALRPDSQRLGQLSPRDRSKIEHENIMLSKALEKPIDQGISANILEVMMKRFTDDYCLLSAISSVDMSYVANITLHKKLKTADLYSGLKIINPIILSGIALPLETQRKLGISAGSHIFLNMIHMIEKGWVDIYSVDNNGDKYDQLFQISAKKEQIQKDVIKSCENLGIKVRSAKSNTQPTHDAPSICGISSVHNMFLISKMNFDQSLADFFEQITNSGGIPDPLQFLKTFKDQVIEEMIAENSEKLSKQNEESKSYAPSQIS
jgi:hypothetical protein